MNVRRLLETPRARRALRASFWTGVAAILVLSLLPSEDLPELGVSDKLEHAAAYGAVALPGLVAYRRGRVLAGLLLLGAALEAVQATATTRRGDVADIAADAAGLFLAWLAVRLAIRGPARSA